MLSNLRLRSRLLVFGIVLSMLPLLIITGTTLLLSGKMIHIIDREIGLLADADLDHIAKGVYAMCRAYQDVVREDLSHSLAIAREVLSNAGGATVSADETVQWDATDQYTKVTKTVQLPKLMIGGQWLGKNETPQVPTALVDKVQQIAGATCTIFQRIAASGDMLRVATNVMDDGRRAIGTYIPHRNPDGTANPVVAEVLKGGTFRGRAFVVNQWYITAYEPIFNAAHQVIGMLYVGIPQEGVKSLREGIVSTKVGQSGYVFVIDGSGTYVISKDGREDGRTILEVVDAQGNYPVKDIIAKALSLEGGNTVDHTYYWQDPGETAPRLKIARVAYFKEWDWIIGVAAYSDEFQRARMDVAAISRTHAGVLLSMICLTAIATVAVWLLVARGIALPLEKAVAFAKALSTGDFSQKLSSARGKIGKNSEIGQLYVAFNHLVTNLGKMFREVKNGVITINASSCELDTISTQMNRGADETSARSRSVAAASEQMSVNMRNVAAASEQAAGNVTHVAESAEEMSATVQDIARKTEKARTITDQAVVQSREAMRQVDQLGTAASEINKVTEVITDISEQTNLLALNATIEAARAGEAGRGFAVVAHEIKELAGQTALATLEIRQKIEGIQSSTGDTVEKIKETSLVIRELNEIVNTIAAAVEQQAKTTQGIAQSVNEASTGLQEVNANMAQSTTVAENIALEITDVNAAADEMAISGSQLKISAADLKKLATRLDQIISQFRTTTARFDIGAVKSAHLQWRSRLEGLLRERQALKVEEIAGHHDCAFGKWYDSPEGRALKDASVFVEVGERHEKVHVYARKIAEAYQRGDEKKSAELMVLFEQEREKLFAALDELYLV